MSEEGAGSQCCSALLQLGAIAGMICLVVYSSMALADNSRHDLLAVCPHQDIWVWLVVMVAMSGVQLLGSILRLTGAVGRDRETDRGKCTQMIVLAVSLGVCIGLVAWGGELLFAPCAQDNLRENRVWYMAFIYWAVNVVVLGLVTVVGTFVAIWMCCRRRGGAAYRV